VGRVRISKQGRKRYLAPLLLTKCGGTPCGEAIWLVFVAQGSSERLLWNLSAGGILPLPWLEL